MFKQDRLITKGDMVVILGNLRKKILSKIHEGHKALLNTQGERETLFGCRGLMEIFDKPAKTALYV